MKSIAFAAAILLASEASAAHEDFMESPPLPNNNYLLDQIVSEACGQTDVYTVMDQIKEMEKKHSWGSMFMGHDSDDSDHDHDDYDYEMMMDDDMGRLDGDMLNTTMTEDEWMMKDHNHGRKDGHGKKDKLADIHPYDLQNAWLCLQA